MSYTKHALKEFSAAGWVNENGKWKDGGQKVICEQVLELLNKFSEHDHSGATAPYAIDLFSKLAKFKPLVPLTGEKSEWNKIAEGIFQNNRCSHVFKKKDGKAYDIYGTVFRDPNGVCYTNNKSKVYIDFPYTPTIKYCDVKDKNSQTK